MYFEMLFLTIIKYVNETCSREILIKLHFPLFIFLFMYQTLLKHNRNNQSKCYRKFKYLLKHYLIQNYYHKTQPKIPVFLFGNFSSLFYS